MALKNLDNYKETLIDVENVIIGSGAGGSTTAFELLKKNKKSLILEEGPNPDSIDKSNIGKAIVRLYKNNGATPMISFNGGPLIGYGQGSCVGGSTYVNAGYFSNTPEWIFEGWIKNKRTNISYADFQKYYNEIKNEIKISTEKVSPKDLDSQFIFERSNQLNWSVEKCERFSDGLGEVNSKQNMNQTYHKKIHENNINIIHDCEVIRIQTKGSIANMLTVKDKLNNKLKKIKFKNLFINCGPINTPHLLIKNKIIKYQKNQNNFEFHTNFKVIVKFKNKINKNLSTNFNANDPVSIFFLREFEKEGVLLSSANSEIPYLLATASHFNDKIKNDIYNSFENYAMYVYQFQSKSYGQVKSFLGSPFVDYNYNKEDFTQIQHAMKRLTNFFLGADAEFILFPVENSLPVSNLNNSNDLINKLDIKKLHLVSVHGMSSLRSGPESNTMTTTEGKIKNFSNIFVNDASILPGNTGESPQASVMSFAKHNIQNIKL